MRTPPEHWIVAVGLCIGFAVLTVVSFQQCMAATGHVLSGVIGAVFPGAGAVGVIIGIFVHMHKRL